MNPYRKHSRGVGTPASDWRCEPERGALVGEGFVMFRDRIEEPDFGDQTAVNPKKSSAIGYA
jgi:hypothetical protein